MNKSLVSATGSLAVPVGNLDAYIAAANQVEILTASEERSLARRFRDDQDLAAARELVVHHLRFVIKIARGYMGYGLALGDLIQEGNIGLMKAVKRFDPEMEVRLVSFAVHWIRAEIHEFVLRNWRIVKIATTKAQRKLFFNLRSAKKRLAWFSREEVESVADDLGVTPEDVIEMESRLSGHDIGFDVQPDNSSDHQDYAPAAYLEDHSADPAQNLEQEDWESYHGSKLSQALITLDARSQDILRSRWLNGESRATLTELAEKYEVSAERIRQLENAAMLKLRKLITD